MMKDDYATNIIQQQQNSRQHISSQESQDLVNINDQIKQSQINLSSHHGLSMLKPEEWKNIPVCVVSAMKLIMENNESLETKIKTLNHKIDQIKMKGSNSQQKYEKEIGQRDESLRQEITAVERQGRDTLEKRFNEINNMLQNVILKQDHYITSQQMDQDRMNNKISKISLDSQNAALQQEDMIAQAIKGEFDRKFQLVEARIDDLINQNFHIPGLVGEYEKYPTFREYCLKSHETFIKRLWKLERTSAESVSQKVFKSQKVELETQIHNNQKFCEKELGQQLDTVRKELTSVQTNLTDQLEPLVSQMKSEYGQRIQTIEQQLQQEISELNSSYQVLSQNTVEVFQHQMESYLVQSTDEINSICNQMTKEFTIQTEDSKNKQIECLESKFFSIDYKIEHIEKALEAQLENYQAARVHSKQVSSKKLTSSINNSEGSLIPTKPQLSTSSQQLPPKKIQLANPFRYQEVKDKLDFLESQLNQIIDQLSGSIKPSIQQKHSEFQAMKDFQKGVKKLLDAKRFSQEISKPDANSSDYKPKIRMNGTSAELEEDNYKRYYEKPESGFSQFRKQQAKRMSVCSSGRGNNTTKHQVTQSQPQSPQFKNGSIFLDVNFDKKCQTNLGRLLTPQSQQKLPQGNHVITQLEIREPDPNNFQGKSIEQINKMKVFNAYTPIPTKTQILSQDILRMTGSSQNALNYGQQNLILSKQATQKGPITKMSGMLGNILNNQVQHLKYQQEQRAQSTQPHGQRSFTRAPASAQKLNNNSYFINQGSYNNNNDPSQDYVMNISSSSLNLQPFNNRRPVTSMNMEKIEEFKMNIDLNLRDLHMDEGSVYQKNNTILEEEAQNIQSLSFNSNYLNKENKILPGKSMHLASMKEAKKQGKRKNESQRVLNVCYEGMNDLDKFKQK